MSARRLTIRSVAAMAAVCGFASAALAADSLLEAMAKAYVGNPELLAQRARLRAVDEEVPQALSGWRPTVSVSANAGFGHYSTKARGTETRNPASLQLEAAQPLYSGGRNTANLRSATLRVRAERARLAATEQAVFLAVGTAFMDVVRDQAVVELTANNANVLSRRLEAAEDQFEVGEVTRTDVSQAEARLARASAERVSAEGALEASRAAYRRLVGEPPGRLEQPAPVTGLPESKEQAAELAAEDNPLLRAASFDERAAIEATEAIRAEALPSLSLVGAAGHRTDATGRGSRSDDISVTARLSVPLYRSGAVGSRLRAARQNAVRLGALAENQRRSALEQAVRAWENLLSARARLEALSTEVRASEIALNGVQQEAEVGTRTLLDVLDAEQDLLDARVNVVRTQRAEAVASFQLTAAVGRLTADAQGVDAPLYDVDAHYDRVRNLWRDPSPLFGGETKR